MHGTPAMAARTSRSALVQAKRGGSHRLRHVLTLCGIDDIGRDP
ncbi:hypothetical protein [Komagataeibacter xylinus]|nr:hypothetical protein [Komagataeibacter xylinus]